MERENRNAALKNIMSLAKTKGFVTFDDLLENADKYSLSIGDLDWLSETVHSRNIIVYDESPDGNLDNQDDVDDYAQADYDVMFDNIISLNPELSQFISSIRNIIPPQRGEVARLKYQVIEGNEYARTRMLEMYLRLAVRIAYQRSVAYDYDIEEAIGDACVGLVLAVDKYNPDYSGPFVSFASMWIFQTIQRRQPTQNLNVYFPMHRKEMYYAIYPYLKKFGCISCDHLHDCAKATEMIRSKLDCTDAQTRDIIMSIQQCLPLDKYCRDNPYDYRFVCSDDDFMEVIRADEESRLVNGGLAKLSDRQREVIVARFGIDNGREKTLEQVGQKLGLTRERIRQIEAKAIKRLQNYYRRNRL